MGNYKFKFSDMIPNAWFHKLKHISRTKNDSTMQKSKKMSHARTKSPAFSSTLSPSSGGAAAASPQPHQQRKSYHFTRDLPPTPDNNSASQLLDQPRKSSRRRRSIKKNRPSIRLASSPRLLMNASASASTDCSCRASLDEHHNNNPTDSCSSEETDLSVFPSENGDKPFDIMVSSCHCRVKSDIPISMTMTQDSNLPTFDSVSQFELKPIITKTNKIDPNDQEVSKMRISHSSFKEKKSLNSLKRLNNTSSPGLKLRTNSPRIASKRFIQVHHRKSVSSSGVARRSLAESFAVVKTSQDPHRDFKDSMVEMIMEYNIRTSKDLEDLLACYLSLNSDKYHELIIKVFKQIWFEITDIRFK